jgi:feruloyl esterase
MEQIQSFYRVIYVNGMFHCNGGPGAWDIGQIGPIDVRLNSTDKNVILALVDWTENGKAPNSIIGSLLSTSGGIQTQRSKSLFFGY